MSGEAKTVSELCREALELRGKAPFRFESIKDENRLFADLDPQYFAFDMPESLANHLAFAANHIKTIAERCLELEEEVVRWKGHFDVKDSTLKHVIEENQKIEAENQKLLEALQYIFQEIENVDPDNRSKRDHDFHAHIMGFWMENEDLKELGEL